MLLRTKSILPTLFILVGLCGCFSTATYALEGRLILPKQAGSSVVFKFNGELTNIEPSKVLKVYVGSSRLCCNGKTPVAGRYSIEENTLTFIPAFSFIEGQRYTVATFDLKEVDTYKSSLNEFSIERSLDSVHPEIVSIYPSGKNIPENTLRFYIHFSTPMKPHVSNQYIKLVDSSGKADTEAFMSFKQELWSEDRKRLTLLMDPGRIKRGVAQNLTLGPALQESRDYSIVVEEGWPTANNATLMSRHENDFTVSAALRTLPHINQWTITSPKNQSLEPLIIKFDRPFDNELLRNSISVLGNKGLPISGVITIEDHETTWRFIPADVWNSSEINIVVDTELEDVAGNNLLELLDHSVNAVADTSSQKMITLKLKASPN